MMAGLAGTSFSIFYLPFVIFHLSKTARLRIEIAQSSSNEKL